MQNSILKKLVKRSIYWVIISILTSNSAFASSAGDLPFTSTMNMLKDAISGPFLLSASIIMFVATCLVLAFGEWGDGFKKLINIVLWLSIAFGVTSFITTMFGGGAVF